MAMRRVSLLLLILGACQERPVEPAPGAPLAAAASASVSPARAAPATSVSSAPLPRPPSSVVTGRPANSVPVAKDDPLQGKFTLEQALAGLKGDGDLYAVLRTSAGKLSCQLFPDKAPITVANFVGLARGLRPYKKDGKWIKKRLYDGTEFYSVLKNFAIEGGSPGDRYNDDLGYYVPDEIWDGANHGERGLLCMRAFTPDRNGSQFMILDAATPQLNQSFTIFGKCETSTVLDAISNAPLENGRPKPAIKLHDLQIVRSKQPLR
jgi:peptidyl-prolyl cis-trans isomerase A (cyclophilin A)